MVKDIYIRCSDLAKLTGDNRYEPISKTVNHILSSNKIEARYVPKSNIEGKLVELNEEQLSKLKIELSLDSTATKTDIEKAIKSTIMKYSYSSSISEQQSKANVDHMLKNKPTLSLIQEDIKKDLRMSRGNIKENSNLNKVQKKHGIEIGSRNSKMYKKLLYQGDVYNIYLRGKVDGISESAVIEAKNRTSRLFKELRSYEQVQLETYMFLTGLPTAILTEHYNDESFEITYEHDELFWQRCIDLTVEFIDTHIKEFIH